MDASILTRWHLNGETTRTPHGTPWMHHVRAVALHCRDDRALPRTPSTHRSEGGRFPDTYEGEVHSSAGKNPSFFTPFTVTSPRTPSAETATAMPAGTRTLTPPKTQSTFSVCVPGAIAARTRSTSAPPKIAETSAPPERGGHHPRIGIAKQDRLFDCVSGTRARILNRRPLRRSHRLNRRDPFG